MTSADGNSENGNPSSIKRCHECFGGGSALKEALAASALLFTADWPSYESIGGAEMRPPEPQKHLKVLMPRATSLIEKPHTSSWHPPQRTNVCGATTFLLWTHSG